MKKSHERWNEYQAASSEYPEELYRTSERLEKRIKKESRKKKFFFTTIPTAAAAMLFVILVNTSIVFARTVSEIPLLSKISELVMYNEALKNAVDNEYIQYVNKKSVNGDLELKLPYIIADSHNLVLFFQLPDNMSKGEDDFYLVSLDKMTNLETGEVIDEYVSYSGSTKMNNNSTMNLTDLTVEFMTHDHPDFPVNITVPKEIEISVALQKRTNLENGGTKQFDADHFTFTLSLGDFKEPVVYPLNQEVILEGQRIIFREMVSYPTRSEITYDLPDYNEYETSLYLSLIEDGEKAFFGSYFSSSLHLDDRVRKTFRFPHNYFDPPKSRSISIDSYFMLKKDEKTVQIDLQNLTMTPELPGIKFEGIEREDGKLLVIFKTDARYDTFPFTSISHEGKVLNVPATSEGDINDNTLTYILSDGEYSTLEFELSRGPLVNLKEPILIPIPLSQ